MVVAILLLTSVVVQATFFGDTPSALAVSQGRSLRASAGIAAVLTLVAAAVGGAIARYLRNRRDPTEVVPFPFAVYLSLAWGVGLLVATLVAASHTDIDAKAAVFCWTWFAIGEVAPIFIAIPGVRKIRRSGGPSGPPPSPPRLPPPPPPPFDPT